MSSQSGSGQGSWQLKRVNSITGPTGTILSNALQLSTSVPGQTEVLYSSPALAFPDPLGNLMKYTD